MANQSVWSAESIQKRAIKSYELLTASYHEAGHTLYGLLHFMQITSVQVYSNVQKDGDDGVTCFEVISDYIEDKDSELFKHLTKLEVGLFYSGFCAERIYFEKISGATKYPYFLRDGSSDDVADASNIIRRYNLAPAGKKRYKFKQNMIKETITSLEQNWDDVVIVSHALFQKKRLYYSDLKSLLLKKSPNKSFWKEQFKNIEYICNNKSALDIKKLKTIVLA